MEIRDDCIFAALAGTLGRANSQFGDGFFRVRERQNVFAEQGIVGFEQMPDAFGDDARLAGASAGDDQQRPVTMRDGAALRVVEEQACAFRLPHFKKSLAHRFSRLTPFPANLNRWAISSLDLLP